MRFKYPRTPHLPNSPGATDDDRRMFPSAAADLFCRRVVITEKMDGGNVTLARKYFHARSTSSDLTPVWEQYAKSEWASIAHEIPTDWRVSAESLWARRSIAYDHLPGYLLVIGIWDEHNTLLTWSQTEEWASMLGLPTVPVLGRGYSDEFTARGLWLAQCSIETSEGFVVRSLYSIPYDDFARNVAKWVRPNHVQTDTSWRHRSDFPTNRVIS